MVQEAHGRLHDGFNLGHAAHPRVPAHKGLGDARHLLVAPRFQQCHLRQNEFLLRLLLTVK